MAMTEVGGPDRVHRMDQGQSPATFGICRLARTVVAACGQLQLNSACMHLSLGFLLSRINGDAPALMKSRRFG